MNKKIGILIEKHFDETEYTKFNEFFPKNGYQVDYMTHLWGAASNTFTGNDVDETHITAEVSIEINNVNLNDYDGIILIGGYAMDRLRYEVNPKQNVPNKSPAVEFLRKAASIKGLKIGTICHSLWLFCAAPELLKCKRVTCAHNIICDVENAGGIVVFGEEGAVNTCIDGDLITGKHPGFVDEFLDVYLKELQNK